MNTKIILFAAIVVVMTGILAGCTPAEKKEQVEKEANASKYQDMAAQRGMTRGGAAGGGDAGATGQSTSGAPSGK